MEDPYLDRSMRGWIINHARKNYWRVAAWYDIDDLVQDGFLCYYKCRKLYPHIAGLRRPLQGDRKRLMALVMAAFNNHIINLAKRRTTTPEIALSQELPDAADPMLVLESLLPPQPEEATLRCLLASAPKELVQLVELLLNDGKDGVRYLRDRLEGGSRKVRETTNEHYCRRLGYDPSKVDLIELVTTHLLGFKPAN